MYNKLKITKNFSLNPEIRLNEYEKNGNWFDAKNDPEYRIRRESLFKTRDYSHFKNDPDYRLRYFAFLGFPD